MKAWLRRSQLGAHLLLLPLGLLVAAPFFWMLSTSLKTRAEAALLGFWPSSPQWHNYATAWSSAPFARYYLVSGVTAVAVTGLVVLTALLAGYAFGALEWRGKRLAFTAYLATMMVPFEVILIPNFLLVQNLGWTDTFYALILPWAANVFSVFLVTQAFRALPRDFYEAAVLDGCGHLHYLLRVAAPLVMPSLATVAIFAFLGSWNSLLWPVVVTSRESMRTIEMGLSIFLQEEQSEYHLLMAASVLTLLPVLALFLAMQRRFIEGLAAGLKG
ncbi:MAG: carbohydrate ABC transporter permease [Armatimonadetes bacterium]|nr:carbohydrate ABC transporter permease [Armatimonadota bacterium]